MGKKNLPYQLVEASTATLVPQNQGSQGHGWNGPRTYCESTTGTGSERGEGKGEAQEEETFVRHDAMGFLTSKHFFLWKICGFWRGEGDVKVFFWWEKEDLDCDYIFLFV